MAGKAAPALSVSVRGVLVVAVAVAFAAVAVDAEPRPHGRVVGDSRVFEAILPFLSSYKTFNPAQFALGSPDYDVAMIIFIADLKRKGYTVHRARDGYTLSACKRVNFCLGIDATGRVSVHFPNNKEHAKYGNKQIR